MVCEMLSIPKVSLKKAVLPAKLPSFPFKKAVLPAKLPSSPRRRGSTSATSSSFYSINVIPAQAGIHLDNHFFGNLLLLTVNSSGPAHPLNTITQSLKYIIMWRTILAYLIVQLLALRQYLL